MLHSFPSPPSSPVCAEDVTVAVATVQFEDVAFWYWTGAPPPTSNSPSPADSERVDYLQWTAQHTPRTVGPVLFPLHLVCHRASNEWSVGARYNREGP